MYEVRPPMHTIPRIAIVMDDVLTGATTINLSTMGSNTVDNMDNSTMDRGDFTINSTNELTSTIQ